MREFAVRLLQLDRRFIFVLMSVVTVLPLLYPLGLPVRISPETRQLYDTLERLPERSVVLLSLDFDPASKPELYPMTVSLLRHAFARNLRVVALTLWPAGTSMAESAVTHGAEEAGKKDGTDYVFLGYGPGEANAIISLGQSLTNAFPTDYAGRKTETLPVLAGVRSLRDIDYALSLSAGFPGLDTWYVYGKEKYGFELGGGCTAVSAPKFYPLLQTGQITGLLGGLRGAAEYETLLNQTGKATAGMDAQSATHFLIIGLIIVCNLCYLLSGRKE